MAESGVSYRECPTVTDAALNALFADAWPGHSPKDFHKVLAHSLGYVCAYSAGDLIGFVNVAWDGGLHAFLLDPTVRSDMRRRGIGRELVRRAADLARRSGVKWLHVDYAPELRDFYLACGFRETEAGLIDLEE
jgi:GNAT superfamily N-acetyltransferase